MPEAPESVLQGIAIQAARRYGIDVNIFLAQINYESGFRNVSGGAGEMGPGQIMPGTWPDILSAHPEIAEEFGNDPWNATANLYAAAAHMADLLAQFGNYDDALAAYNGGVGGYQAPAPRQYAQTVLGASGMTMPEVGLKGNSLAGDLMFRLLEASIQLERDRGNDRRARELEQLRGQQQITLRQIIGAQDMAELERRFELESLAANANRETQLLIQREQAKIDERAANRGWERTVWMDAVARSHDILMLERGQEFEAEQGRLSRENQLRQQAIGELGSMERTLMQVQQQARQYLAETTGRDPIRAALMMQGNVQRGRTPTQAFRNQLRGVIGQQAPQVNLQGPLPQLLSAVGRTRRAGQMPAPGPFAGGLAGGGTIEMKRGAGGAFSIIQDSETPDVSGNTGVGVLLGERAPEVMEILDDEIRVIPLVARGQGGLSVRRRPLGTRGLAAPARPRPSIARPAPRPSITRPAPHPPRQVAAPTAQVGAPVALAPPRAEAQAPPVAPPGASALVPQLQPIPPPTTKDEAFALRETAQWVSELVRRIPNVDARDAAEAQRRGLPDIYRAILQFTAGFLGPNALNNAIQDIFYSIYPGDIGEQPPHLPPDEAPPVEPPAPVEPEPPSPIAGPIALPPDIEPQQVLDFVNELLRRWPNVSEVDAMTAQNLGFPDLADLITQVSGGLIDTWEAYYMIDQLVSQLQGMIGAPGEEEYDPQTITDAIERIYQYLGIPTLGTEAGRFGGTVFGAQEGFNVPGLIGELGWNVRLVRNSETGQVFAVTPDGQLQAITGTGSTSLLELAQLGIMEEELRNIITMSPAELAQFGELTGAYRPQLGPPREQTQNIIFINDLLGRWADVNATDAALARQRGLNWVATRIDEMIAGFISPEEARRKIEWWVEQVSYERAPEEQIESLLGPQEPRPFAAPTPLIVPGMGIPLPRISMIAGLMGQLRRTQPGLADVIEYAYELAGVPLGDLRARESWFTPTGTFDPSQVARFG